jgi:anti-sigma factor ChrR (cupin superfamily)
MHSSVNLNLAAIAANPDLLAWEPHDSLGRIGTRIHRLYQSDSTGQQVALVLCAPGSYAKSHLHIGHESYFVISGNFEDDFGKYGPGELVVLFPGSVHSWHSPTGALLYAVWGGPVVPPPR